LIIEEIKQEVEVMNYAEFNIILHPLPILSAYTANLKGIEEKSNCCTAGLTVSLESLGWFCSILLYLEFSSM